MEKELLQQALNSILHGSTQIVSSTDNYGNNTSSEIRVNDLRIALIDKLTTKLVNTDEFRKAISNVFSSEVTNKLREKMLDKVSYSDLPYDVKQRLEKEMKETKLEIKSYKLVAEVIKP